MSQDCDGGSPIPDSDKAELRKAPLLAMLQRTSVSSSRSTFLNAGPTSSTMRTKALEQGWSVPVLNWNVGALAEEEEGEVGVMTVGDRRFHLQRTLPTLVPSPMLIHVAHCRYTLHQALPGTAHEAPSVAVFVSTVRALAGSGWPLGVGDDGICVVSSSYLVVHPLAFFSPFPYTARLSPSLRFISREAERETEQFDNAPLEFIHLDLALPNPQITFWRGSVVLVAISNDVQPWSQAFTTRLSAGIYCNIIHGSVISGFFNVA
ncbi:hypothetical protein FIBSPDRAFT_997077 [Athelia psychrophila]|uniref:Uncharacterized protein n=1 Tax=Athelia psychrophila TaxID=1759441 RepID=A0A165WRH5_9AGAM|nr:hypothetical protein FIBSPDRAFT_997077 [Fibularhizoctonia sp. CBS 109695]